MDDMDGGGLPRRALGPLETSALGIGGWGLTGAYGAVEVGDAHALLASALEHGISLVDTADAYGPRTNEELVGRAVRPFRDDVVVATKFGLMNLDDPARAPDGRPDYVRNACDASLRRLGVDHIDLYLQHRLDPEVPVEETVGAMGDLVRSGKVRHLGLCEVSRETVERAHATHPIAVVQSELSIWSPGPRERLIPRLDELGIGFMAYSPLGRGFLTGTVRSADVLSEGDWRRGNPRFAPGSLDRNLTLVDDLRAIATAAGLTPAQLALAWTLRQGDGVVAVFGTRRRDRVAENVAAASHPVSGSTVARIEAAIARHAVVGERYSADRMVTVEDP